MLHRDEGSAFVFADIVDHANVGVVQAGSRLGLAPEARQRLLVFGRFFRQEFQRHESPKSRVFSLIHHPHPAATKLRDDVVMSDFLADHSLSYHQIDDSPQPAEFFNYSTVSSGNRREGSGSGTGALLYRFFCALDHKYLVGTAVGLQLRSQLLDSREESARFRRRTSVRRARTTPALCRADGSF